MATGNKSDNAHRLRALIHKHNVEYVRFLFPDFHGLLRGKVFPSHDVDFDGESITICSLTFTYKGQPSMIAEQDRMGFGNIVMRPRPETFITRSWRPNRCGAKVAQVLCDLYYLDGKPVEVDLRRIAKKQIDRLDAQGLALYSGSEFEFRVYKANSGCAAGSTPAHDNRGMFLTEHMDMYEDFMVDLEKRLRQCQVKMYTMHNECGRGALEIPLRPAWGMDTADNSALFKMLVKETARDNGFEATFMTKDLLEEFTNASHFNHSVWRRSADGPMTNAFFDPNKTLKFSDFGRHWLAGLIHHSAALTALCCPTVNCYRRIGAPWAPQFVDWGFDNRYITFRYKISPSGSDTFIENRLPSAPANPYLVLAATVAAGLDGVERKLELPAEHSKEMGELPRNMAAALEALKEDKVICEALGQKFLEWYVSMKTEESADLKDVDVLSQNPEDIKRERDTYLFTA